MIKNSSRSLVGFGGEIRIGPDFAQVGQVFQLPRERLYFAH